MYNVIKWANILYKSCGVTTARFLKYVWPFNNIMHERVKRKLNNVSLIQKCKVIQLIKKGMINKAASEKFRTPRNTISTCMKNKNDLLQSLEQTSLNKKKLRGCDYEQVDKAILKWFSLQRS